MSADNMICIQRRGKRWWVWMDFASNDDLVPRKSDRSFKKKRHAEIYAEGWARGEMWLEYGIVHIESEKR